MATRRPLSVLRLIRTDDPGIPCIVLIYSNGPEVLDIELIASEGQSAWATTIAHKRISKLRAQGQDMSEASWREALKHGLQLAGPETSQKHLEGVEMVSMITSKGRMNLLLRRSIGELTQRLGIIELQPTEDDNFDLWAGCVAGAGLNTEARQYAQSLSSRLVEQNERNRVLQRQLKDLEEAKLMHENALVQRFSEVLNAKKAKVREQQRLLAIAKFRRNKYQSRTPQAEAHATTSTRHKAQATLAAATDDNDSSSGFESAADDDASDIRGTATPEVTDDDDATDHGSESQSPPVGPASAPKRITTEATTQALEVPPKRKLPFTDRRAPTSTVQQEAHRDKNGTKSTHSKRSRSTQPQTFVDSASDTTDDEL